MIYVISDPLTVLICDDSMLVQKQLKQALKNAGVEIVLQASNGKEALQIIEKEKPQILFLDIVMPIMNGINTLKQIRRKKFNIIVIMISSSGTQANLKRAFREGANDFITKPWKEEKIITLINKIRKKGGS